MPAFFNIQVIEHKNLRKPLNIEKEVFNSQNNEILYFQVKVQRESKSYNPEYEKEAIHFQIGIFNFLKFSR